MNVAGGTKPRVGCCRARKGLHAHDLFAGEVDDRLVVHLEVPVLDRPAKVGLEIETVEQALVHRILEDHEGGFSGVLAPVHGHLRVAENLLGVGLVRAGDGNTEAQRHGHLGLGQLDRLADLLEDPDRGPFGFCHPAGVLEEHGELVAVEARDRVAGANGSQDPHPDFDQEAVAFGVAHPVVDQLEVVDVEIEDADLGARLASHLQGVLEAVNETSPVRQSRQRVMLGQVMRAVGRLLQGVDRRRAGDGEAGRFGKDREDLLVRDAVDACGLAGSDDEPAHDAPVLVDRRRHGRSDSDLHHVGAGQRRRRVVLDDDGPVLDDGLADGPLADTQVTTDLRCRAVRGSRRHRVLVVGVDAVEQHEFVAQHLGEASGDGVEHLVQGSSVGDRPLDRGDLFEQVVSSLRRGAGLAEPAERQGQHVPHAVQRAQLLAAEPPAGARAITRASADC